MNSASHPRAVAVDRLARAQLEWPDLPFQERGTGGLADAVALEAIRRWRTISHLVRAAAGRDSASMEPMIVGVLFAALAQCLFMDEPVHAVVDWSVEHTRRRIHSRAAPFVNAVLRRVAAACGERIPLPERWWLRRDVVPRADGGAIRLPEEWLPEQPARRLGVLTSHADWLLERWIGRFGLDHAAALALRGVMQPPRVVADPRGTLTSHPQARPHRVTGFVVWSGSLHELLPLMKRDPSIRIQDAGSARAVARTSGLGPRLIVDACAGRGTKTRQLAELHPGAGIVASDRDPGRLAVLRKAFESHPRVRVVQPQALAATRGADLLVLDVPCSNTGVLPRRPEAKCRFDARRLASLVESQRTIVESYLPVLAPSGRLLHVTCSIEAEENESIWEWLSRTLGRSGAPDFHAPLGAPGADPAGYADGGASAIF